MLLIDKENWSLQSFILLIIHTTLQQQFLGRILTQMEGKESREQSRCCFYKCIHFSMTFTPNSSQVGRPYGLQKLQLISDSSMTKYEIHLQFDHCLIGCYSIFFLSDHDVLGGHIYNLRPQTRSKGCVRVRSHNDASQNVVARGHLRCPRHLWPGWQQ